MSESYDEKQARLEAVGEQIVKMLEPFSMMDRQDILGVIKSAYCVECGKVQPEDSIRGCQCWNDE